MKTLEEIDRYLKKLESYFCWLNKYTPKAPLMEGDFYFSQIYTSPSLEIWENKPITDQYDSIQYNVFRIEIYSTYLSNPT